MTKVVGWSRVGSRRPILTGCLAILVILGLTMVALPGRSSGPAGTGGQTFHAPYKAKAYTQQGASASSCGRSYAKITSRPRMNTSTGAFSFSARTKVVACPLFYLNGGFDATVGIVGPTFTVKTNGTHQLTVTWRIGGSGQLTDRYHGPNTAVADSVSASIQFFELDKTSKKFGTTQALTVLNQQSSNTNTTLSLAFAPRNVTVYDNQSVVAGDSLVFESFLLVNAYGSVDLGGSLFTTFSVSGSVVDFTAN